MKADRGLIQMVYIRHEVILKEQDYISNILEIILLFLESRINQHKTRL